MRPFAPAVTQRQTTPVLFAVLALCAAGGALLPARAQDPMALPLNAEAAMPPELRILDSARRPGTLGQVRIEGRVVVRIAPSSDAARARMLAELPRRPLRSQWQEVAHEDCVPVAQLAGVQPLAEHRLLLFTRDRQVIAATLERSCSAEAFYSGFYVEDNADGRLCVARDRLQSRTGSACAVTAFHRVVAQRD